MNLSYVGGQTVEFGEFKPTVVTGKGPTSYSQTTKDPVSNPGAGDYIAYLDDAQTQSGLFSVAAFQITAGQIRAGAASPVQSGWKYIWISLATGLEVANGTNL